jgi:mannose/cellobiose epimerase-like protein (N-acyl-D-glucosamine 2-epimerase family)
MSASTLVAIDSVETSHDLVRIAKSINADLKKASDCIRKSLLHIRSAGERLIEAKELVPHGGWLDWLDENTKLKDRTAQLYMQIGRDWDQLQSVAEANAQDIADLGLQQAIQLLAKPRRRTDIDRSDASFDDDADAFARPTFSVSKPQEGRSRIKAREEEGDDYEVEAVSPSYQQDDQMSDSEIRTFQASFMAVANRLASLSRDAKRLPNEHELLESIQAHMDDLELAFMAMKESLSRE